MRYHNEKMLEDDGIAVFLQQLVDGDLLEGPALGICRQVIAQGQESLTEKQEWVLENVVTAEF